MANKVKFGLRNVYYSIVTETGGTITYATPVKLAGAVTLSLAKSGDVTDFYADDSDYYRNSINNGYEGTLEVALLPDAFKTAVLGMVADNNGAILETADDSIKKIAIGGEVQGDDKGRRVWFYYCTPQRPDIEASTTEGTNAPQTETLPFSVAPRPTDRKVKIAMTKTAENSVAYEAFFTAVYEQVTSV